MKKNAWSVIFVLITGVMMSFCCRQVYAAGTVESIVIKNMPTKTSYVEGDKLNTSGLAIRVSYSDGTTQDLTSGFTCTPSTFTEYGEQDVTVSYSGKTATYKVNVAMKTYVITQPSSVNTNCNTPVSFTFKVRSQNVTYQWYIKKAGTSDWTLWKGHTTSKTSATPNATWNHMQLYCAASDAFGNQFKSNVVSVILTDVLEIYEQPATRYATNLNCAATLRLKSRGKDLTYQWYYKKEGESSWCKWKGMRSSEITFTAERWLHNAQIRCIVKDGSNHSTVSRSVNFLIYNILQFTAAPSNITINAGEKATFSVSTSGSNVKYQWYIKKSGAADWTLWRGHTEASTSATSNDSWSGMQVRCRVTDDSGDVLYSSAAVVTIRGKLALVKSPESVTVKTGETVTFSAMASGAYLTNNFYQWYYRKKGAVDWTLWKNHTSATTTGVANDSWNGMQVYCLITDGNGNTVSSAPATVTIGANASSFAILSHSKDITAKVGNNVTFAVIAKGDELQYQWYYKKSGAASWCKWNGRTTSSTTAVVNATWNGMKVRCLVRDRYGSRAYSDESLITVTDHPITITSQPQSISIRANHKSPFSVSAKGEDLDYQWYYKKKGATAWSIWRMYTTSAIEPPSNRSWDGMQVRCEITDAYNNILYSDPAAITILPDEQNDFRILKHPRSVVLNTYRTVTFSVDANGTKMTYQWYYARANSNKWILWEGKNLSSVSHKPDSTWNGMQLYCVVTNGDGEQLYSDIAKVTITDKPFIITEQPSDITTKAGKLVTFSVKAKGEGLTYQWYYMKNSNVWKIWNGYTGDTVQIPSNTTWNGLKAKCRITDTYGNVIDSNPSTVTLIPYEEDEFRILTQPKNTTDWRVYFPRQGSTYSSLSVNAYGTDLSYQWYFRKADQTAWSEWEGATDAVSPVIPDGKGYAYCVVTNTDGEQIYSDIASYQVTYEDD